MGKVKKPTGAEDLPDSYETFRGTFLLEIHIDSVRPKGWGNIEERLKNIFKKEFGIKGDIKFYGFK